MVKIKDLPKYKRPREKLSERGAENLTDAELLAILIRTGRAGKSALDIAKETLKRYPLKKLLSVSQEDLINIKGLEKIKAITIQAALELGRRASNTFNNSLPVIDSVNDALVQLNNIRSKQKEYFVVLYLNARKQLIQKETISIGTITETLVHPREVFEPAIRCFACSVILAHNHPDNNSEASENDLKITEKLIQSGAILDIEVLDHIIVTNNQYISFKEENILFK